jgi:hypothetical protein
MFYVENWSLSLDLAIIFGTATSVIMRAVRQLGARRGLEGGSTNSDRNAGSEQEFHDRAVVLNPKRMASRAAEPAPVASAMAVE